MMLLIVTQFQFAAAFLDLGIHVSNISRFHL